MDAQWSGRFKASFRDFTEVLVSFGAENDGNSISEDWVLFKSHE